MLKKMHNFNMTIQSLAMEYNVAFMNATQTYMKYLEEPDNLERFVDHAKFLMTTIVLMWVVLNVCACCSDPFGENLRKRLKIVESELSDAEEMITDLDDENEKLKAELARAKLEITEMESRYISCRQAAQKFIDTPLEYPTAKRQRVDSK